MKHALLLNCFFKTSISILSNHACIVRFNYSRGFFKEIIVRFKYVILFSLSDKNKLQKHGFKKFKPVFCFLIKEECKIVDKRYFLTGFTREQDWFEKLVIMNKCGFFLSVMCQAHVKHILITSSRFLISLHAANIPFHASLHR